MKKYLCILLILFISISIAACSKEKPIVSEPITEVVEEEILEKEVIEEEIIPEIVPLLTLENEQVLTEFETNYEDITLKFDNLTIHIPMDAYDSQVSFKIVTKDIVANKLELIKPISALYEIDNGNVFSKVPILLQIPLDTNTDGFVMAFYFDQESETLEGIPSIRLETGNLLIMTYHFSNIFVGMMSKENLEKYQSGTGIDTKFTPGIDDFSFVNSGSYIAPEGHCGGQSIAAMWYFKNIRRFNLDDPSSALHGLLDNNGLFSTPDLWEDDSLLYRFASSVHLDMGDNNDILIDQMYIGNIDSKYKDILIPEYDAKDHWDAFLASMIVTNRPQLIAVYREEEGKPAYGHAMIVYKIEGNKLYISDPNSSGEIKYIKYENEEFSIFDVMGILMNRVYFLGEFATIDEWKVEKRWNEVINKDSENEYFPDLMFLSDGITTYEDYYLFNIEVSPSDLQDKLGFYVMDENMLLQIPTLNTDPVIEHYPFNPETKAFGIVPVNNDKVKIRLPLQNEGYNWLGFHFVDKNNEWVDFKWIEIFKDTNLQLTADKYIINPGDTTHIEASMSSGIEFPDLTWIIDENYDLDNELEDDIIDNTICINSKTCDYTADELGTYEISANNPLSDLRAYITITVTDNEIEEHIPIPEEDSHIANGTYNCSFWLSAYEAEPFENFTSDVWYTADQRRQLATDNANSYNEMYAANFGEITYDKEDFIITVHDDGTCDITFSTFLFVNSNSEGVSNASFNGGSINWTAEEGNAKFEGNVILSLTADDVMMKGTITKKSPENQFMFNETKTYSFEGEKIY